MAEGGGEFGDDETTPLIGHTDDRDDDDVAAGGNETTGFAPGSSSTPNGNQRQTTMNRTGEQPSFVELPDVPALSTTDFATDEVVKEFPFVQKSKVFANIENERVKVALIKKERMEILYKKLII